MANTRNLHLDPREPDTRRRVLLRSFARSASVAISLVGSVVLVGWMFNVSTFKSLLPGLGAMNAATAIACIVAGLTLKLLVPEEATQRARLYASGCIAGLLLIAAVRLTAYFGQWDFGLDVLLFQKKLGPDDE